MNIFAGNLLFTATEGDVKKLFEGFGDVASAVIVMTKDKKTPKSRGFGFVDMPDEQQALAAIAALDGKEFMGRILNVSPARPETEARRKIKPRKARPKLEEKTGERLQKEGEQGKAWFSPVFNKRRTLKDRRARPSGQPGTYRGGRRTRSYMKRQGLAGIQEEVKPRPRSEDNPMRWRKRKNQAKPWQKVPGEHRPWKKNEVGARPWKKPAGDAKPWKKPAGDAKPWKKPAGDAKPWSKSSERPQKSGFKGRRKPGGYKRQS